MNERLGPEEKARQEELHKKIMVFEEIFWSTLKQIGAFNKAAGEAYPDFKRPRHLEFWVLEMRHMLNRNIPNDKTRVIKTTFIARNDSTQESKTLEWTFNPYNEASDNSVTYTKKEGKEEPDKPKDKQAIIEGRQMIRELIARQNEEIRLRAARLKASSS